MRRCDTTHDYMVIMENGCLVVIKRMARLLHGNGCMILLSILSWYVGMVLLSIVSWNVCMVLLSIVSWYVFMVLFPIV